VAHRKERISADKKSFEVAARPRKGSIAACSGCRYRKWISSTIVRIDILVEI
jgi:hypothetical protein